MKRIVDLSLDIYDKAPTFWPDPKTSVTQHLKVENLGYNITQLVISTHLGTHLDAPRHFFDTGTAVDKLDITNGFGPAWVLDFTHKGAKDRITPSELELHADKIGPGARILVRTGWDKSFPDDRYFAECPGLNPDACRYLADAGIACLGMDTPTICGSDYLEAHHALLGKEVLIVEGLANLDKLESNRVFFQALPLRIRGCDGSPCRAIAIEGLSESEMEAMTGLEIA
ncbi:MAG: cyclase family protein [Armatimonadetes bacterium]|nr:cyclase family protein [Armatimonadota bacterium]